MIIHIFFSLANAVGSCQGKRKSRNANKTCKCRHFSLACRPVILRDKVGLHNGIPTYTYTMQKLLKSNTFTFIWCHFLILHKVI